MKAPSTSDRREWLVVLLLTALGAALRFWSFGRLGLTHFDEGVYALAGLWAVDPKGLPGLDPSLISYAPPGFAILVGLAYSLFGVADLSALFVSIVCGIATIPVVAWVARRTFGPGAGASAAALAAVSIAHIAFSRKALTDVPFTLTWLVAIGLGQRFLERPGLLRALAFGAAVGLAQNFKYNGWLAGAIVVLSASIGLLVNREDRRAASIARTFGYGLIAALIAGALYWPWYRFVEQNGGYAALVRHHRGYMSGIGLWIPHWRHQLAQRVALSGGTLWCFASWGLALLVGASTAPRRVPSAAPFDTGLRFTFGVCSAIALLADMSLSWWVGLILLPRALRDPRPAVRTLAVWWLVLSIMTPFYHPYARLWLPLHAAEWVLIAGWIMELIRLTNDPAPAFARRRVAWTALVLVAAAWQQVSAGAVPFKIARFYQPTDAFRVEVDSLADMVPAEGASPSFRILARRPLAYYLLTRLQKPVHLQSGLKQLLEPPRPEEWAIVDEAQVLQETDFASAERRLLTPTPTGVFWKKAREWSQVLDPVTQLDVEPGAVRDPLRKSLVWIDLLTPSNENRGQGETPHAP
jgi:dolichyl-phosphate-mannose-protein mannosyltransferase